MDEIRDCRQRLVCRADAKTGQVEQGYKQCFTRTKLPIGGQFSIERDGALTVITRVSTTAYVVPCTARGSSWSKRRIWGTTNPDTTAQPGSTTCIGPGACVQGWPHEHEA